MAIKAGSLKKEEGYVADSILIAEIIDYIVEEGPFSYYEVIEDLSQKILDYEENASESSLIHGRSPEKYLDVIVRHSKFFKDYFESDANDECHTLDPDWDDEDLIPDDDDEDYESDWSDEDDVEMAFDPETGKSYPAFNNLDESKKVREAKCYCEGDGVCYCEDVEPKPKKELKDFVWLPNNADQAYRESKAPSQLSQSCQKEAMVVDYVKKLQHEAETLFNEYDVALAAADKIKDDKVNYNYLLSQAFTNKKIAERLADIAADLGHILEEQ